MNSSENKKTFLISAYACEPGEGSEPGVGWNWAIELSKIHRVIVITRNNNRKPIEKAYFENQYPYLTFEYCDLPKWISFWKRGQKGLYFYYFLWQLVCYKRAKAISSIQQIDYAVTLTFGNMWLPTFMHKLPCEFIWGPIGGGEGVPKELWSHISRKQIFFEYVRNLNKVIPFTNPCFFKICRAAKVIIVRTKDSFNCIPKKYQGKCKILIETGVSQADIAEFSNILREDLREECEKDFLVCGRLVPFKLVKLAVEAFEIASVKCPASRLHIVGDGPDRAGIELMVREKNLEHRVFLYGKKSREETVKIMASCRALLLTSTREGGSWVMFEAMLLKKPIICFDTSGMAVLVTNETGWLIPVCEYSKAAELFARAIEEVSNGYESEKKGKQAYLRVTREFTWSGKIERLLEWLGEKNEEP